MLKEVCNMAQFIYRRPPYPAYDMEGIESWLEDLASDGLMLDYNGYLFGLMQFQPNTPKRLKYRLEPIEKLHILFPAETPPPPEKKLTLYADFGWEYLGTFYDFYIYRSTTEDPVELNTDPTLQAAALQHVCRRSAIFLVAAVMLAVVCNLILIRKWPLINIIERGWQSFAALHALVAVTLLYSLLYHLHTAGLQKKLQRGEQLTRNKNWRRGRILRRVLLSLPFLFCIFSAYFNASSTNAIYANEVDAAAYTDPLPFVTVAELIPDRTWEPNGEPFLSIWTTPLTHANIHWSESIRRAQSQEDLGSGELEVRYHEAAREWIAKALTQEYKQKQDQRVGELNSPGISYSNADYLAADYGFDELYVYDSFFNTVILIREGKTVIRATCALHTWSTGDTHFTLWLEQTAAKMT